MRTCSSPEDDPGVMEDETVGALAGRSGVVMAKTRPVERKKSTLHREVGKRTAAKQTAASVD